jgi:hypothetical protein
VWNNHTSRRGKFLTGEKQIEHGQLYKAKRFSGSESDRTFRQLELENYVGGLRVSEEPIPGLVWRVFSSLPAPKAPQPLRALNLGPGPGSANSEVREAGSCAVRAPGLHRLGQPLLRRGRRGMRSWCAFAVGQHPSGAPRQKFAAPAPQDTSTHAPGSPAS